GLVILPGAILMGIMSPFVGKIFDKFGARILLITGFSILAASSVFFTQLTSSTSMMYLTIVFTVRMFGIAMLTMSATTAGLNELPNKLMPHGTAMTNTMRQVAASIGTATLVTIMSISAKDIPSIDPDAAVHGVNIAFYVATGI